MLQVQALTVEVMEALTATPWSTSEVEVMGCRMGYHTPGYVKLILAETSLPIDQPLKGYNCRSDLI